MSTGAKNKKEQLGLREWLASFLLDRTIVLIGLVFVVFMVILIWRQAQLEDRLVESTAQEEARRYTEALATFRKLYTREVVETVRPQEIVVTHDYELDKYEGKAIPLPATLSMLIGNEMAKQELGGQTALYSGYPFPTREGEWKERDQFSKDAWQALTRNPDEPYQRFEDRDGQRWFRYATADLMRKSCIECHNNHPKTPKDDWKEGDVRGVLEVRLPLDRAVAQTRSNLRESIFYMVAIGGLGFVGLIIVIGRLRRSSHELELGAAESTRAEQRFRNTVEAAPTAMVMIDRQGIIVLTNEKAERLFGYARGELLGQVVEMLMPERFRTAHPQLRSGFFSGPEERRMGVGRDLYGVRKDGSEFPVEIGLSQVETDEGVFVLSTIVDITERIQLEKLQKQLMQQREAELDFAYLASRAQIDGDQEKSAIVRETGDELTGIESFDDAMDLWARQARNIIGAHQSAVSYIPSGNFAEGKHAISLSDKYEKYKTYDVLPTGDGIWRLVAEQRLSFCMTDAELKSHPAWKNFSDMLDDRGLEHPPMHGWLVVPILSRGLKFVGVLQLTDKYDGDFAQHDLEVLTRLAQLMAPAFSLQYANETVQRHSEELAEAKDALEQSNMELQQFAFIASHDLQSPLRAVAGFAQFLQRDYRGQLDEKADEHIERIVEGAKRMQQLINDLLDYSRVEPRSRPFAPTDLNKVFDDAVAVLSSSILDSDGQVTRGALPTVSGDRSQLSQLLQNLIGNGLKYQGDQPPRVHVSAENSGSEWTVAVRDTGIGIDAKHHERIFEIFRRLHTADEYPGTGIGLAVCRRIVQRQGGRIWLESELGKGSTFYFTIPKRGSE